ncbi:aldo/keto reductase [Paractinoplanes globisporus]|uniref:Aldo/keto reductase n=1 Tax=Paractinoplanes globisporus TaxID=113565 RepID=A0ABW6WR01_9ACTN|nr:aldo/keto reductase [Actinoplanes globisporus]
MSAGAVDGGTFALGRWRVRRAGYGAMQLAGDGVFGPPRDRDEAIRVLRAAVAAGVDHIDTAQFYGAGTVNALIREALHPYPDGLAIVSKVAGGGLRRGIEQNLAALGAERLAAVNLRVMEPAEIPGARFDADPLIGALGDRLGATPTQVQLAWLLDLAPNVLLIPGTRTRAHLAENLTAAGGIGLDEAARADLSRRFPAPGERSTSDRR